MGLLARIRGVVSGPAAQPPVRDRGPVEGVWGNREVPPANADEAPLSADEEEARRQADLIERDFRDRGPGRWNKFNTLWRRR